MEGKMIVEKKLGKIKKVYLGLTDGRLGLQFELGSDCWGVMTNWLGAWHKRSEHAKWTVQDQKNALGEAFLELGDILEKAKKRDVSQLVGIPIEATFDGMVLKDWRVLEEVL